MRVARPTGRTEAVRETPSPRAVTPCRRLSFFVMSNLLRFFLNLFFLFPTMRNDAR